MKLSNASKFFDRMTCVDAYTGLNPFKAQLDLFDDSQKDTQGTARRILSTVPSVTIPARRTIAANETHYIVGDHYDDNFNNAVIRRKYVVAEAHTLANYNTLEGTCLSQAGTDAYATKTWVKDSKDVAQVSDLTGQYRISFSNAETVGVNDIISYDGGRYIVRQVDEGSSGILDCIVDQILDPAVEDVNLSVLTYDPITEVSTPTLTPLRVVRLRWQSLFEYRTPFAPKFNYDDAQVVVAKSAATPSAGSTIVMSDGNWVVNNLLDRGTVWVCHVSRKV